MNIDSFNKMYLCELQETRSLEKQWMDALPKMTETASDPGLKEILDGHMKQTCEHHARVEDILKANGAEAELHKDHSMERLISETSKWADMVEDSEQRDAGLIASVQRIEHYQMAVYGTLAAWAKRLGRGEEEQVFRAILREEREADERLTKIAEREVNPAAA